jgi:DNA-binding transcriptional ArsR family regulator
MPDEPDFAGVAAIVGDPARARMLTELLGGLAMTATELALAGEVAPSTASVHLARLVDAGLLAVERQGLHRSFRLAAPEASELVEGLAAFTATRGAGAGRRFGPRDPALRAARVCYDHLAGARGVELFDRLRGIGALAGDDGCALTAGGEVRVASLGIDLDVLRRSRRVFSRPCLDWSERRPHLGGALGAALFARMLELDWVTRAAGSRAVRFTARGERGCAEFLAPELPSWFSASAL